MSANQPTATRRAGRVLFCVVIVPGLFVAGCNSGSSLPKMYKVTGSVTYVGGRPVAGGAVQFAPLADTSFSVSGDINDDGTFTLQTVKGNERVSGAPEGEYRVTILFPIPADQRTVPPIVLPKNYRIEAKDNEFPIEVSLPGKKP